MSAKVLYRLIERLTELTATRDREAMDICVVQAVRELLGATEVAIVRLLGDAGKERWLVAAQSLPDGGVRTADASWIDLDDLVPMAAEPAWAQCVQSGEGLALDAADASGLQLLMPLRQAAGVVGVLRATVPQAPDAAERRAVQGLLEIFRNQLSTLDYTESDTLTGLLNRKSFDDTFYKASALPLSTLPEGSAERRLRAPQRYWLGVIDIDHFKQVNDQHGHLIGDEVLLLLSRVMRQSFRFLDRLYRFGGEEFVVLMRCPDEEGAMAAMERFRQQVASFHFSRVEHVTVSIGFTDVRTGDTPPAAVERADLAVYYAKHHGRDQVRSHAALVRAGALADTTQTGDVEFF